MFIAYISDLATKKTRTQFPTQEDCYSFSAACITQSSAACLFLIPALFVQKRAKMYPLKHLTVFWWVFMFSYQDSALVRAFLFIQIYLFQTVSAYIFI